MSATMRRGWRVATIVLFALSIFTIHQSVELSLMDRLGPGPGFFPFWLALLGALLSLILFVEVHRTRPEGPAIPLMPRGPALGQVSLIVASIAVTAALLEPLGFRLAMLLFNGGLLFAMGERRWWAVALFAVTGSFGVYHVFNNWLDVVLPVGRLGI
ncbi:MAG: tripartite tricarboxylate transporter TctB family protein [Alphaproteobacteria bacterium]|nr:tripartite tricarboxylate transporter TctB family protein [Alphaproteobacteria bacterium]